VVKLSMGIKKQTVSEYLKRLFSSQYLPTFFRSTPLSIISAGMVYMVVSKSNAQVDLSVSDGLFFVVCCNLSITSLFVRRFQGKPTVRQMMAGMIHRVSSCLIFTLSLASLFIFYSDIPVDIWLSGEGFRMLLLLGLLVDVFYEQLVIGFKSALSKRKAV